MIVRDFEKLNVWQKSMDLVEEVYRLVKMLPKEETYALSDQMRRAVVSIPSNIAEGYMRKSTKEYVQFLSIAQGSRAELYTQILICKRLKYITEEQSLISIGLTQEIGKMLSAIINSL